MKKIFTLLFAIYSTFMFAQAEPYGYGLDESVLTSLPLQELATFNHDSLWAEDTELENRGGRTNVGRVIDLHLTAATAGTWTTFTNGDRLWQYRFRSANALGVCMYFEDLYIPQGAVMFLYSIDRKTYVGPFTLEDCNAHGRFMMGEVLGDEAILEYYEPAGVISTPRIGMQSVGHMYRYVYDYSMYADQDRGSESCEVDVNCPEGADWVDQRDAVVRLLILDDGQQFFCSGTIMNNVEKDCRRFLLTAMHCGEGVSDQEWQQCSVRFRFQRANCGSGSAPSTNSRTGVFHLADSNDGGGDSGSDFLLLEVEDAIPASYNVYYAGWDARTATPADVVCIHHPAGDVKKISTATTIISSTWPGGAPGHHWQVTWMATETNHGVTEGGSSGSPIFNAPLGLVVGQLTGGASLCTSPTAPDFFGKMDRNWDDNPNAANQKLKVFLDPNDTGAQFFGGGRPEVDANMNCYVASIEERELEFAEVRVFPTIADEFVRFQTGRFREMKGYQLYNSAGLAVLGGQFRQEIETVHVADLPSGVYFVTFMQQDGAHLTKKLVVRH
jgi:hypothetical protein